MKELKIPNFFQLFNQTCYKQTFALLNNNEKNMSTFLLAQNRNVRKLSNNMCGPLSGNIGWNLVSQNTFLYRMKIQYNRLPRNLTLSPNYFLFKSWLSKYTNDSNIVIPVRKDNSTFIHSPNINHDRITQCQQNGLI